MKKLLFIFPFFALILFSSCKMSKLDSSFNCLRSKCEPSTPAPFVSVWQTTASPETITLPLRSGFQYDFIVDWGDGSDKSHITAFDDAAITHAYLSAGTHTMTIKGLAEAWYFGSSADSVKILSVTDLGDMGWKNFERAFEGCTNLTTVSGGVTSSVTNMSFMFSFATSANPNTISWNTSAVTDMSFMFDHATAFNQNISAWDTSAVTNMTYMFDWATAFNQNIDAWDTSAVIDMSSMFYFATAFNQNISTWDTSAVTNMTYMFSGTTAFNQNISAWDTSAVTDMSGMFNSATAFNQNISNWSASSTPLHVDYDLGATSWLPGNKPW